MQSGEAVYYVDTLELPQKWRLWKYTSLPLARGCGLETGRQAVDKQVNKRDSRCHLGKASGKQNMPQKLVCLVMEKVDQLQRVQSAHVRAALLVDANASVLTSCGTLLCCARFGVSCDNPRDVQNGIFCVQMALQG